MHLALRIGVWIMWQKVHFLLLCILTHSVVAIHGSVEVKKREKYIDCRSHCILPTLCSLQVRLHFRPLQNK